MSCWTKEELENMLEDVVNELDLSDSIIEEHGPMGTEPAELVRLVLARKDREIEMLRRGLTLATIKQRTFWGDINKKVVFDFVEKQIFKKG